MRTVVAVVVQDGRVVSFASNTHDGPCMREGYPTGEGYNLCKWCDYPNHAEHKALQGIQGGTLYLIGHSYACELCVEDIRKAGVTLVLI